MKKRYEGLLILNTKGNEEGAKEIIERLEGEFKADGAEVEQVQKLGRHQFSYVARKVEGGFYTNFIFQAEPEVIEKLKTRFRLDNDILTQHYQRLDEKAAAPASE